MAAEENLKDALLRQEAERGTADLDLIVRRERNRMRWWTAATAALWITTTVYFVVLWVAYMVFVHPALHELLSDREVDAALRKGLNTALLFGLKALLAWPLLVFVSAACTTWLVLTSRRSTLRQIQANLSQISTQLEDLLEKKAPAPASDDRMNG